MKHSLAEKSVDRILSGGVQMFELEEGRPLSGTRRHIATF